MYIPELAYLIIRVYSCHAPTHLLRNSFSTQHAIQVPVVWHTCLAPIAATCVEQSSGLYSCSCVVIEQSVLWRANCRFTLMLVPISNPTKVLIPVVAILFRLVLIAATACSLF